MFTFYSLFRLHNLPSINTVRILIHQRRFNRARWVVSRLQAQHRGRTTRKITASKTIQSYPSVNKLLERQSTITVTISGATSPLGESCPLTVQDDLLQRIEQLESNSTSVDCCLFPLAQCSPLTKLHRIERLEYVFDPRHKKYNAAVTIARWYRGCLSRAR